MVHAMVSTWLCKVRVLTCALLICIDLSGLVHCVTFVAHITPTLSWHRQKLCKMQDGNGSSSAGCIIEVAHICELQYDNGTCITNSITAVALAAPTASWQ